MANHLIVTTVGTSIFTNFNKQEVRNAFDHARVSKLYDGGVDLDAVEDDDAGLYDEDCFQALESKINDYWLKSCAKENGQWKYINEPTPNHHASAEITSILKIAAKIREEDANADIEVQLLATDTALSVSAAKLVGLFFKESHTVSVRDFDKENDFIASLGVKPKTGDMADAYYDTGLQNLVDKLMGESGIIKKAKKDGFNPVINFSGGYKSTIPVLTIIAQLEGIPMYYIYEDSDHLMEVGNLPFDFDWAAVERLHYYLDSDVLNDDLGPEILEELKDRKLISLSKSGYKVSPLGRLFRNVRDVMPDGGGTFGKIVEVKLWEHFVKNPLIGFSSQLPKRSLACHRHNHTGKIVAIVPDDEKGKNLYTDIEIDLTFYDDNGNYAILESKSISGIKGVKPNLYFAGGQFYNNGELPTLFRLIIYKYEHEKLTSRKQQLRDLKSIVFDMGVPNFEFYYFNLPLSKDKARINYQQFIDSDSLVLVNGLEELGI